MESILLHTHSGLRWIFIILMIFTLIKNYNPTESTNAKAINLPLYTLILFSLQIIIGLGLYFMSKNVSFEAGFMKNTQLRFYTMEHAFGMILAFIIMLIGYLKLKNESLTSWNKIIKIYYGIALFLILASIPWPFRGFGNSWF